jgi:di/tripeptidase
MSISSIEDRKKIFAAIREISNSMVRIEAEKDLIKDIVKDVADNYQLSRKVVNKMARVYHKQSLSQTVAEHDEFVETYEEITSANSPQNSNQS